MPRGILVRTQVLVLVMALLVGCGGAPNATAIPTTNPTPGSNSSGALDPHNINLIFVVSPDLAYQAPGDVNPGTANLTAQGLQRSLLMAAYLKQQVVGGKNVNRIYALEPMTHLQTAAQYPDMAAIGYIQQFAMLNQISITALGGYGSPPITDNSYPINVSYAAKSVPAGVAAPAVACPTCQGLDFADAAGSNEAVVAKILALHYPGFYVFSAPWETVSPLLVNIDKKMGAKLSLPASFTGPNDVYALAITPEGKASLATYHSNLNPLSTYPELPSDVGRAKCQAAPFNITAVDGVNGAKIPARTNTNETVYMLRHAEAHPVTGWEDGNYVAAGQWRALALPNALKGKINPSEVYSIDPAQATNAAEILSGGIDLSYVRAALTAEPYAVANNLPFHLVADIVLMDPKSPQSTGQKFFNGGQFSNKTILLSWEHNHLQAIVTAFLASYYPEGTAPKPPDWAGSDYDSIWSVTLDAKGNLTVSNSLCEGIDSTKLPAAAPQFGSSQGIGQ